MSSTKKFDINLDIGPTKIVFEISDVSLQPVQDDIKPDKLRLEIHVAKLFHKVLNFISTERDLFQRDDFKLLGEMLGRILIGKKFSEQLNMLIKIVSPDSGVSCRIYLDFNGNPELAELPWEYIQVQNIKDESKGESEDIYLSANAGNRFQLIRRLNKQEVVPCESEKLNVILLICNKDGNGITRRDSREIENVFKRLKDEYPDQFSYRVMKNPEKESFPANLMQELDQFEKINGRYPPYSLHYFGHSRLNKMEGELVFNSKTDGAIWVKDVEFAGFFDKALLAAQTERETSIDLPSSVLFQSCDSAKIGDLVKGKGVAIAMCKKNIQTVIGMQNEIDPTTSSKFSEIYYEQILDGADVAEAVTLGRYFLGAKYEIANEKDVFGTNSFGNPVLFINTRVPNVLVKINKHPMDATSGKVAESTVPKKKCIECGELNDEDSNFCKRCSKPFRGERVDSGKPAIAIRGDDLRSRSVPSRPSDEPILVTQEESGNAERGRGLFIKSPESGRRNDKT
jgi:hypothetical protein